MHELRRLPSVNALADTLNRDLFPSPVRVRAARTAIEAARAALRTGNDLPDVAALAQRLAEEESASPVRPALNLSGVILHTGLGRAVLAREAQAALVAAATGHGVVEFDLESGTRGDRQTLVRDLLCELTGAEDALVVNNCAAAVVLALAAVASGREVLLSRGQMVEIGGAFRMPDVIRESGCRLVEVGCTNKTRLSDFECALGPETAVLLRCHESNFRMVGFAEQPEPADLAALARRHGALFLDDAGSGCLVETERFGLPHERTLREAVSAGADLVMASGDKLLGGPQAGIILGGKEPIARLRRHPLARAFRVCKLTLAPLAATLRLYRDQRETEIPVWRSAARDLAEIRRLALQLRRVSPERIVVERGNTEVGGGSMPGRSLPTWRAGVAATSADGLARALRLGRVPVVGRVEDGRVWLDPRTLEPEELPLARRALADALERQA